LKFRSGNASGSDEACAAGVLDVAPERMQIFQDHWATWLDGTRWRCHNDNRFA